MPKNKPSTITTLSEIQAELKQTKWNVERLHELINKLDQKALLHAAHHGEIILNTIVDELIAANVCENRFTTVKDRCRISADLYIKIDSAWENHHQQYPDDDMRGFISGFYDCPHKNLAKEMGITFGRLANELTPQMFNQIIGLHQFFHACNQVTRREVETERGMKCRGMKYIVSEFSCLDHETVSNNLERIISTLSKLPSDTTENKTLLAPLLRKLKMDLQLACGSTPFRDEVQDQYLYVIDCMSLPEPTTEKPQTHSVFFPRSGKVPFFVGKVEDLPPPENRF